MPARVGISEFASPHYTDGPFEPEAVKYWLPVDLYVGGAEHAAMHLLYARFWTKVLYDAGLVHFVEPFKALRNQGMVLAPDPKNESVWIKMSKSKGNVITPDEIASRYGADALRVYELFVAPMTEAIQWSEDGINACIASSPECGGLSRIMAKTMTRIGVKQFGRRHQQALQTSAGPQGPPDH